MLAARRQLRRTASSGDFQGGGVIQSLPVMEALGNFPRLTGVSAIPPGREELRRSVIGT